MTKPSYADIIDSIEPSGEGCYCAEHPDPLVSTPPPLCGWCISTKLLPALKKLEADSAPGEPPDFP